MGRICFTTGDFTAARDLFQKAIDLKPGFYVAHLDLKQAYDALGATAESAVQNGRILEILPNYLLQNPDDARARMFYAITLAETNRRAEAIAEGSKALELAPDDSLMLYNGACLYAQLGEPKRAIATLREAIAAGVTNFQWMMNDPDLYSLHDDPEFQALVKEN